MFRWYHHPSSGAQTTVSTASGICYTVIVICCYRGRVGTGLSVLWVAGRTEHEQQRCYHHAPTVKPEAVAAVVGLLMMGMRMPETC